MCSTKRGSGKATSTRSVSNARSRTHGKPLVPSFRPPTPPADLHALIQQAVQQALAAQQPASTGQASANGHAPEDERPAGPDGWGALHQVTMERRSNARGSWWSPWLASEQRYGKGA
jgi:hypothetical protein